MEKEEFKKYKGTVSKIKEIMKYEAELRKLFGNRLPIIKKTFGIMEGQMNALAKDKKIKASGEEKSRVKETVNLFLNIAVNQPITSIFRDLSRTYLLLAFNWNKELGERPDMEIAIKATQRIVEGQLTMLDTVNLLKELVKQSRGMLNYRPPAFELSRHYLESLQEEARKKEKGKVKKGKVKKGKAKKRQRKIKS